MARAASIAFVRGLGGHHLTIIMPKRSHDSWNRAQVRELMEEMGVGPSGSITFVRGLGGLGTSVELIGVGLVATLMSVAGGVADAWDRVVVSVPGVPRLMGFEPDYAIQVRSSHWVEVRLRTCFDCV
jgi:hypothetical protein